MDMQIFTIIRRLAAIAACAMLVASCGGGGGGSGGGVNNDTDGDGVANTADNCPGIANANQLDTDGDGTGDACDSDDDQDTVADGADNCPLVSNPDQLDTDGDGAGNVCDGDDDNDTFADGTDNCPLDSNPDQLDTDMDGAGDACDTDDDDDGVDDGSDNCPLEANPDQADSDGDGIGDVCDTGADVTVSGKATFDRVPHSSLNGLDYTATRPEPVRNAVVQIVDATTEALLATATTDDNGDYSALVPSGTNVMLRLRAESQRSGLPGWKVSVVDNTNSDALYTLQTPSFNTGADDVTRDVHADSGWGGTGYSTTRAAAPFAILDSIWTAMQATLAVDPDIEFPRLTVKWSPDNRAVDCPVGSTVAECEARGEIGNTFFRREGMADREILLLGAEDADTDEYDGHIIVHEWGHYFEDAFSRADTLGGSHTEGDRLDPRVAYSEGWGYAYAGIASADPVTRDSLGTGQSMGFAIDVEKNANINPGWFSEGSVQSIIYDIVDDDALSSADFDGVALGFPAVFALMTTDLPTSEPPLTIFSFVTRLKALNPGIATDIDTIVAAQDIVATGMDIHGSTETNDEGRGADVLPVYTTLTVDGPVVNVCTIDEFGIYNKLSNRRFLTLDIATDATYRFRAAGPAGADPDVALHSRGLLEIYEDLGDVEEFDVTMSPGEYTVEVYEFTNVDAAETPRGRTCIDVSVQQL